MSHLSPNIPVSQKLIPGTQKQTNSGRAAASGLQLCRLCTPEPTPPSPSPLPRFLPRMAGAGCEGPMWCSQPLPRSQSMWRTFRTRHLSSWAHPTMATCTRTPFRWVAAPLSQGPLQIPPACHPGCPGPRWGRLASGQQQAPWPWEEDGEGHRAGMWSIHGCRSRARHFCLCPSFLHQLQGERDAQVADRPGLGETLFPPLTESEVSFGLP